MEIFNTCILGVGTVFIGLICIIALVELMHLVYTAFNGKKAAAPEEAKVQTVPAINGTDPLSENRGEVIAAVSAAIAEELGTEANAIRITKIRKI